MDCHALWVDYIRAPSVSAGRKRCAHGYSPFRGRGLRRWQRTRGYPRRGSPVSAANRPTQACGAAGNDLDSKHGAARDMAAGMPAVAQGVSRKGGISVTGHAVLVGMGRGCGWRSWARGVEPARVRYRAGFGKERAERISKKRRLLHAPTGDTGLQGLRIGYPPQGR